MTRASAPSSGTATAADDDFETSAAEIADFADEVEIGPDAEFLPARGGLRKKVKQLRTRPGDLDPVASAEAAVARMAESFDGWMVAETNRLGELFTLAEETAFDGEALEAFHRAAHDIKGQAATLGFPLAGRIAGSLCRLIEAKLTTGRIPRDLVEQHVQSVRAIILEQAREQGSPTARRLAERLDEVTHDYLDQIGSAA